MKNHFFALVCIIAAAGLLSTFTGCPIPNGAVPEDAANYTVTATVVDTTTGLPITDADIGFGANTGTTDTNGIFSFTVKTGDSITGTFYASKGVDYHFEVFGGINTTPTADLSYTIELTPVTASARTMSGNIFESDGTTEIPDSSSISISIINENGGTWSENATYSTGYSITTPTFGNSCFMGITVDDGTSVYSYYVSSQDLSAANITRNFTKPSTGFSSLTINGQDGDFFTGTMMYSDSITYDVFEGVLSGTTSASVDIYNPENKSFYWGNNTVAADAPATGDTTINVVMTSPDVPGSSLTFPTASGVADPVQSASAVAYSNGTVSFTGNAEIFSLSLYPDEGGLSGSIFTPDTSITLPGVIQDILSSTSDSYTNWDCQVSSLNASVSLDFDKIILDTLNSDISVKVFYGSGSNGTDLIL